MCSADQARPIRRSTSVTEPTNDRPPIYRIVRGTVLKGKTVTTPDATPEDVQFRAASTRRADRSILVRDTETETEALVSSQNLERTFRTPKEKELGRDFTPEEATAETRRWEQRYAGIVENRARTAILEGIGGTAERPQ